MRSAVRELLAGISMAVLIIGVIVLGLRADYVEASAEDALVRPVAGICRYELPDPVPEGVPEDLWRLFRRYETEEVSAYVLAGVAKVESDFDPECITGVCYGLMQIHSKWEFGYLHGGDWSDPEASIRACSEILTGHVRRYGSIHRALMVYNEGNAGNREGTSKYSRKVMRYCEQYQGR